MSSDLRPGPDSPPTDELASAEAAPARLRHVLHPISRDELSKSTPCSEYDVMQLTDHLMNSITLLGGAAGAELPERNSEDSVERQIVGAARPALDAWHRRGLTDTVTIGTNEIPATFAVSILRRIPGPRLGLRDRDHTPDRRRRVAGRLRVRACHKVITPQGRATVGLMIRSRCPTMRPPSTG